MNKVPRKFPIFQSIHNSIRRISVHGRMSIAAAIHNLTFLHQLQIASSPCSTVSNGAPRLPMLPSLAGEQTHERSFPFVRIVSYDASNIYSKFRRDFSLRQCPMFLKLTFPLLLNAQNEGVEEFLAAHKLARHPYRNPCRSSVRDIALIQASCKQTEKTFANCTLHYVNNIPLKSDPYYDPQQAFQYALEVSGGTLSLRPDCHRNLNVYVHFDTSSRRTLAFLLRMNMDTEVYAQLVDSSSRCTLTLSIKLLCKNTLLIVYVNCCMLRQAS